MPELLEFFKNYIKQVCADTGHVCPYWERCTKCNSEKGLCEDGCTYHQPVFLFKPKFADQEEKFNLYCSGITSCCKCNFSNDEALKIIKENTLKTMMFMSKKEL